MSEALKSSGQIVRGEFFTDGENFIFRLDGAPISGVGKTADAAFADLVRVKGETGDLSERLTELARDQAGETLRKTIVGWTIAALIAFGVVGGALVGAAALAPQVIAAFADSTAQRLSGEPRRTPPAAGTLNPPPSP